MLIVCKFRLDRHYRLRHSETMKVFIRLTDIMLITTIDMTMAVGG
ncbi:hypothetical protein QWY77_04575 [Thalassotalea ponticola]|nr:hypothetical protein [Thalassotalea ponticola]MDN3652042.1 hypothetical protein [Thalassotalea ponticola]